MVPFGGKPSMPKLTAKTDGAGVPSPESLPFEQLAKTNAAANSKAPAIIGTLFKKPLPSPPPPIQKYGCSFVYSHHKPPLKTFAESCNFLLPNASGILYYNIFLQFSQAICDMICRQLSGVPSGMLA